MVEYDAAGEIGEMFVKMKDNVEEIAGRIEASAERSGRKSSDVTLVAVSKFQPLYMLYAALDCGIGIFGENRIQERSEKAAEWGREGALWHMIGHLQRNKARRALDLFDCIQSVDSLKLAVTLDRMLRESNQADEEAVSYPVFVEVNTSGEKSKHGASPDGCLELVDRITEECPNLSIQGLMTIGPLTGDEGKIRSAFAHLRVLLESSRSRSGQPMKELSMGMTGDYEIAVEEGSTLVRIGTGIFGARKAK